MSVPHRIDVEIIYHTAEHETLLTFLDDLCNEAFQVWWYEEGQNLFDDWVKQSEEYSCCHEKDRKED